MVMRYGYITMLLWNLGNAVFMGHGKESGVNIRVGRDMQAGPSERGREAATSYWTLKYQHAVFQGTYTTIRA